MRRKLLCFRVCYEPRRCKIDFSVGPTTSFGTWPLASFHLLFLGCLWRCHRNGCVFLQSKCGRWNLVLCSSFVSFITVHGHCLVISYIMCYACGYIQPYTKE